MFEGSLSYMKGLQVGILVGNFLSQLLWYFSISLVLDMCEEVFR